MQGQDQSFNLQGFPVILEPSCPKQHAGHAEARNFLPVLAPTVHTRTRELVSHPGRAVPCHPEAQAVSCMLDACGMDTVRHPVLEDLKGGPERHTGPTEGLSNLPVPNSQPHKERLIWQDLPCSPAPAHSAEHLWLCSRSHTKPLFCAQALFSATESPAALCRGPGSPPSLIAATFC